jgi:hypothetical protein
MHPTQAGGIKLKSGSFVTFIGSGLTVYNLADFIDEASGASLGTVPASSDLRGTYLSFTVPDLNTLLGDGSFFWLKLLSRNPLAERTIAPYLVYSFTEDESKEEEKRQAQSSGDESDIKPASMAASAGLSDILGVAKTVAMPAAVVAAAGKALASAGKSGASTEVKSSANTQAQEEMLDNEEVIEEVSDSAAQTSTGQVSTGGQTISESGTVTGTVASEVGQSGTTTQTAEVSRGGGGGVVTRTVSGSREVTSGGGTATATQTTNISAGSTTTGQVSASGSSTISGSATETQNTNVNASTEVSGQANEEVKAQVTETAGAGNQAPTSQPIPNQDAVSSTGSTSAQSRTKISGGGGTAAYGGGFNISSGTTVAPQMPMPKPPAGLGKLLANKTALNERSGNLNFSERGTDQTVTSNQEAPTNNQAKQPEPKSQTAPESQQPQSNKGSEEVGASSTEPQSGLEQGNRPPVRAELETAAKANTRASSSKPLPKPLNDITPKNSRPNLPVRPEGQAGDDTQVAPPLGEGNLGAENGQDQDQGSSPASPENEAQNNQPSGIPPQQPGANTEPSPEAQAAEASQLGAPLNQAANPEANKDKQKDSSSEDGGDQGAENPEGEEQPAQTLQPQSVEQKQKTKGLGADATSKAEIEVNRHVNSYLSGIAWSLWASSIADFGLSILIGAVVGDFLWLLKDWLLERAFRNNPLLSQFKGVGLENIKIKFSLQVKAHIIAMNAAIVGLIAILIILVVGALYGYCHSLLLYPVRLLSGSQSFCDSFNKSAVSNLASSVLPSSGGYSASNNVPGGLNSTAAWTTQINSEAQKYNIDACILRVVVQKESGGTANAIGCDCAANGKAQLCTDSSKVYYSGYNFNWAQCSYGIGLTQWTIFPKGSSGFAAWQNATTPSRSIENGWYGVTDLLDPNVSLDLTAHNFKDNLAKASGDVATAFGDYVGASSQQAQLVSDRMALYNLCKSAATTPTSP